MPVLIDNFHWMSWNVLLAVLPIIFSYLSIRYPKRFVGFIFFILWFLFFPNTIYLVTDLQYLPGQLAGSNLSLVLLLIFQYFILALIGIFTYFYALKPMIGRLKNKSMRNNIVFIFNFLVAYAVVLGKVQRAESWDIIFNFNRLINEIVRSFSVTNTVLLL